MSCRSLLRRWPAARRMLSAIAPVSQRLEAAAPSASPIIPVTAKAGRSASIRWNVAPIVATSSSTGRRRVSPEDAAASGNPVEGRSSASMYFRSAGRTLRPTQMCCGQRRRAHRRRQPPDRLQRSQLLMTSHHRFRRNHRPRGQEWFAPSLRRPSYRGRRQQTCRP